MPFVVRSNCPVCGHDRTEQYYSVPYASGDVADFLFRYYRLEQLFDREAWSRRVGDERYALRECRRCDALFQANAPGPELSQELYSRWIGRKPKDPVPFKEFTHWLVEAMTLTDLLLKVTGRPSPTQLRVLDFGMGKGVFAQAMAACGCQVWGYDFAVNRHTAAAEKGIATVSLKEALALQFDFINTEQVFEHLPEPLATARSLTGALSPGGILKISVPYNSWLERGDKQIDWNAARNGKHSPMPLQPLEHLNYFRRKSFDVLAKEVGLTRLSQSRLELLKHAVGWTSPTRAMRNVGRALLRNRVKNYHLLQKR